MAHAVPSRPSGVRNIRIGSVAPGRLPKEACPPVEQPLPIRSPTDTAQTHALSPSPPAIRCDATATATATPLRLLLRSGLDPSTRFAARWWAALRSTDTVTAAPHEAAGPKELRINGAAVSVDEKCPSSSSFHTRTPDWLKIIPSLLQLHAARQQKNFFLPIPPLPH